MLDSTPRAYRLKASNAYLTFSTTAGTSPRSFDRSRDQGPLHLVSAWASERGLSLGQRAFDGQSNEITAIPELLDALDLHGCLVTLDAMGCQKEIAQRILAKHISSG